MRFFLPVLSLLTAAAPPPKTTVTIEIQNIQSAEGKIHISIFKPSPNFPDKDKPVESKSMAATKGTLRTTIDIPPGDYALAVFHDVNGNGKIDKRLFIPKEPYGFSNNVRPKLSAPKFADCQVRVSNAAQTIRIRVE